MARCIFAAGLVALFGFLPVRAADDPAVLRIGFVESILQEAPASKRKLFSKEFSDMVRDFTGLMSTVTQGINPQTAAKQLDEQKWHLGVFHGVEFAWVMAKHPKLKPLMIAATKVKPVKAVLVVKKDGGLTGIADLKGKDVSMLELLHCRLFADKQTSKASNYFGNVLRTRSVEDALDNVLRGKVQAAIVDTPNLEFYKDLQPGRYNQLKIAAESEPFPAAVIVYRENGLSDALLKHLRDSMLKVNQTDRGRESLEAFRVSSFELAPDDYQQKLADILQAYPAPEF